MGILAIFLRDDFSSGPGANAVAAKSTELTFEQVTDWFAIV